AQKLHRILVDDVASLVVNHQDDWGALVDADVSACDPVERRQWANLLDHAQRANRAKPSKAWLKKAHAYVENLPQAELTEKLQAWMTNLGQRPISASNSDVLRGLVHLVVILPARQQNDVVASLASAAEAGCRRGPGGRLLCSKVTVAVVETLALIGSRESAGQLFRLKRTLTAEWIADKIAPICAMVSATLGVDEHEFEDAVVPEFGFSSNGTLSIGAGEYTAELSFPTTTRGQIVWCNRQGKRRKTVPDQVKAEYSTVQTLARRLLRDSERVVAASRLRLDRCYIERDVWTAADWRASFIDHPLVGVVAKRLIWTFENNARELSAIWQDEQYCDVDGDVLEIDWDTCKVRLWHPLQCDEQHRSSWCERLADLDVCQPFKQAHRETYIPTDAEQGDLMYSNRFAGHVVRHSQFRAVAQSRGWKVGALGAWDHGEQSASRRLENCDLKVRLGIAPADGETEASGIYQRVVTGQVRFHAGGVDTMEFPNQETQSADALRIDAVPPLAFSEAMRDIDMFVGVASIGNDPNWQVEHPIGELHADYWRERSFGHLSAFAAVRREVLKRIVPKLKIAGRCTIDDTFLIVRGNLHTYKIHIGSGNILMQPGNRYLCIVADR
ncbi:MAG: DUF4132 domain-containing protein, partial [Planctomycetales bacterium]|nr:DUF4132 domain-containing protein [Planctomycetales bacterium]